MKRNSTSAFLWEAIPKAKNREELLEIAAKHYEALPSEIPSLKCDMNAFLDQLLAWGMLKEDISCSDNQETTYVKIGELYLAISAPAQALSKEFIPFTTDSCPHIDMHIEISTSTGLSTSALSGKLLLHSEELLVSELENEYYLSFPMANQILEATLKKDGSYAHFYCQPPYRETLIGDLFHAIRFVFLYLAQKNNMLALHSASINYNDKAWLFSGSSGTGKSTHTNLWHDQFETPILNGDLNLISITENGPVIHGMPWCGTSQIADPKTYPLGGIILLKQAKENICQTLSDNEKSLLVLQRTISPSWSEEMLDTNLAFVNNLTPQIFVARLLCTKNPEVAHYMKEQIDNYDSKH